MKGFVYTEQEVRFHADWLLFGPALDVAEKLMNKGKINVLDVGCGAGAFGKMLQIRGLSANYVGLDLCKMNLLAGRTEYQLDTLVNGSIFHLPFRDGAFDLTVCYGVIQSLGKPAEAFAEVLRVGSGRAVVEVVEAPEGRNTFFEVGTNGLGQLVALYNRNQLLDHLVRQGIAPPSKVLSRSADADLRSGKPFYRIAGPRIRAIYVWGR
jgi:ubiquinone/menaquinone biosynthesis C-methylase UbiE